MGYHTNINVSHTHSSVIQNTLNQLQKSLETAFGLEHSIEYAENAYAALGCRDELSVTIVVNTSQKHQRTDGDVERAYQVRLSHLTDTQRKTIIDIIQQEAQACYADLNKLVTVNCTDIPLTGRPGEWIEGGIHLCEGCQSAAGCTIHRPFYDGAGKICYRPKQVIPSSQATREQAAKEQPKADFSWGPPLLGDAPSCVIKEE